MSQSPDLTHMDVRYVAGLARIALTDDEIREYEAELDDILEYVTKLQELDVSEVAPTAHTSSISSVWREDVLHECLPRNMVLDNSPATIDEELVRVPAVLDEEGA